MTVIPFFMYGALRVEGPMFDTHLRPIVVDRVVDQKVSGRLYIHFGYDLACAHFDMVDGEVRGDVLFLNTNNHMFDYMCAMEYQAGYQLVPVHYFYNGERNTAFAWHYVDQNHLGTSQWIEDGDWLRVWRFKMAQFRNFTAQLEEGNTDG